MAKHDESKDVSLLSSVCKINTYEKSIIAKKDTIIGNRRWGRIDYLVNHCGYRFHWSDVAVKVSNNSNDEYKTSKREFKKAAKENTLTDKTKKKKK